jgi:DNA-binding NarL/FixJ family response regulator
MVNGREPLSRLEETHLTSREQQILVEVQRGKTNREIAQAFHITPRTVKFHLSNMFCKLHISSRRALNDVASEADYEHDQPPGSGQMVPQHKNPVVVPRLLKKPYSKE